MFSNLQITGLAKLIEISSQNQKKLPHQMLLFKDEKPYCLSDKVECGVGLCKKNGYCVLRRRIKNQ